MNGTKKMASKHRKDKVGKDLMDLFQTTKGDYYYSTKQAANKNLGGGKNSWGGIVTKLLGKNSLAQALGESDILHRTGVKKYSKIKLKEQESLLKDQLKLIEEKESTIAKNLTNKYGKGSIDLETGTFIPLK